MPLFFVRHKVCSGSIRENQVKKAERIQTVKKLTAFREREAMNALGVARQDLATKKARFEELRHYREEYLRNMDSVGRHGLAGQQLRAYQQFLEQLAAAIKQQEQLLAIANSVVDQKQSTWMALRQKFYTIFWIKSFWIKLNKNTWMKSPGG